MYTASDLILQFKVGFTLILSIFRQDKCMPLSVWARMEQPRREQRILEHTHKELRTHKELLRRRSRLQDKPGLPIHACRAFLQIPSAEAPRRIPSTRRRPGERWSAVLQTNNVSINCGAKQNGRNTFVGQWLL